MRLHEHEQPEQNSEQRKRNHTPVPLTQRSGPGGLLDRRVVTLEGLRAGVGTDQREGLGGFWGLETFSVLILELVLLVC